MAYQDFDRHPRGTTLDVLFFPLVTITATCFACRDAFTNHNPGKH